MRKVWKYRINMHPRTQLTIPVGARLLRSAIQDQQPTLWFEVDPEAATEVRTFTIYGTGYEISSPYEEWRGTFDDGPFVWHVYEAMI